MKEVTKDEFFKAVGPLDVHPRVREETLRQDFIVSDWEVRPSRQIIGVSKSGTGRHSFENHYFLAA
jgi:hypothetical protein